MRKLLFLVFFLCCFSYASAIKVRVSGDLSLLKDVEYVTVKFTYDNMIVGSMSEDAYLTKKVDEYNNKKAGRGDEWKKIWESDKINVYPLSFLNLMEKHSNIKVDSFRENKYTIIVNTTFFEPGFNVYVTRRNAEISVVAKLVETANLDKVLAEVTILNSPGRTFMGDDFSVASRVSEAYAKAGKELGKLIKKACK